MEHPADNTGSQRLPGAEYDRGLNVLSWGQFLGYDWAMSTTLDSTSLHRFLEQFTETFTPELAQHFVNLPPHPELQNRLDELGEKANEGTLTEAERSEYQTYVEAMDVIALLRVKSQGKSGQSDS